MSGFLYVGDLILALMKYPLDYDVKMIDASDKMMRDINNIKIHMLKFKREKGDPKWEPRGQVFLFPEVKRRKKAKK